MKNSAALDNLNLNLKDKRSVSYARARAAINECCENRREKRAAKQAVIEYLGGKLKDEVLDDKKVVVFPDLSEARY